MNNDNYTNVYGKNSKGIKTNLDFSQIEKVFIKGQEYLKYIDPETNELTLIENFSNDSLEIQMQKIVDYNNIKLGTDNQENNNKIMEFKNKYDSDALNFISIVDIAGNEGDYENQLASLNSEQANIYKYMIVNRQELKLEKINIERGIGLDSEGNVIDISMDPNTLDISAKTAETTKFEYNPQTSFTPAYNKESTEKPIEFTDEQYMEVPELLDRQYQSGLITLEQKQSIEARLEQKKQENKQLENSQQKKYVYQLEDRKAGFLDVAYYPTILIIAFLLIIAIVIVGLI